MMRINKFTVVLLMECLVHSVFSDACTVKMRQGEKWWGLCNDFGREMPFTEKTSFSCDLRQARGDIPVASLKVLERCDAVQ